MSEGDEKLRALMILYQGGSLDAFQEIYAQLAQGVRRLSPRHLACGSEIADDLLQETFLQIHRSRAAYNPAYAVKPWVFGLARNVFLMNRRAARRRAEIHESRQELPEFPVPPEVERLARQRRFAGVSRDCPRSRQKRCCFIMNGDLASMRSLGCSALARRRHAPARAGEWRIFEAH